MKTFTFRLLFPRKLSLIFAMLFFGIIHQTLAQSRLVSGTVTYNNEPLLGVAVQVGNKNLATITDQYGEFSIGLLTGDVLIFSHIGFKTVEIKYLNQSRIDVSLEEDIEQLVAVELSGAYYSFDERSRTGNVVKVESDQLQQQVIHSPMEALQGRVAGLEVQTRTGLSGQSSLVTLRGQSSLRGKAFSQPLYIIDGIQIENSEINSLTELYTGIGIDPLATLDPSLIESIEVLKDADATAIYGSRGANGVIIINTKRGQEGKTTFELQAETGVSWVGKFMNLMNTEQYLEMRREAFENDGVTPTESNAPDLLLWDQNRYTDWQKELIGGNAEFQKYQATVSGGNAQTSFLLSGGFQKESTVFPGDFGFQNNNLHANINHRSEDARLNLNTSINYGYRKSSLFNAGVFVSGGARLAPNAPALFDEDGSINWELDEFGNPTFVNRMAGLQNPNTMRMQSFQWNGNVYYNLFNGLNVKLNMGINQMRSDEEELIYKKNFNPLHASSTRSTMNQQLIERQHFVVEPQIDYILKLNKHKISSLIGSTFQKNESHNKYLRGEGYFSESQMGNIALAQDLSILINNFIAYRYAALYSRVGYSYIDKFHLNLTGRRDGSSRFGEKNRFGNFGAIGAAWEFYKEDFIEENWNWLSYGKFRGSYGTTGSDNIGDYQYLDTYNSITLASGTLSKGGLLPSRLHNPYYQWEKNTKLELALDIGLWNDRVLFVTSWHRERSGNQLIGLSLPSTTGFTNVQGNFPATVENSGWEFVLQTTPIQTSNFVWNSNINFTVPKNRLVDFPDLESSSYASQLEIGKPINILKLYNSLGVDPKTGQYEFEDINSDGILNFDDRTVIVDLTREFYGGWHNSFSYKNWDFSFFVEFVKQKGRSHLNSYGTPGGQAGTGSNVPVDFLDRWGESRDDVKHQKFTQRYDMGSYNYFKLSNGGIEDTSFLRFKSLSIKYNFSPNLLQNLKLYRAQVYLNAQNLFTITPYKGYDPQNSGEMELPALTSVHLGIKLTI